MVNKGGPKIRK